MKIESVKLVCFSPTGTSKAVARGIVKGINPGAVELIDITGPDARKQPLQALEDDLLVLAVPVYMGRVPAVIGGWLGAIQAHHTPAVCVVVYGNRAYDNALLELKDMAVNCGCVPVAGAAFIGEHSFSDPGAPIAEGRPDSRDLDHAERFGREIREKLQSVSSISRISDLSVPGACPYEGTTTLWDVDFIAVSDDCIHCGVCAETCPVGAVDPLDSATIDQETCITCCACIKNCPQNARTMKPGPVKDAQKRLNSLFQDPKQPEVFL